MSSRSSPCTASAPRSSARRSTRSCPTSCPRRSSRRPTRSTSSCAPSRCGSPARRSAARSSTPSASAPRSLSTPPRSPSRPSRSCRWRGARRAAPPSPRRSGATTAPGSANSARTARLGAPFPAARRHVWLWATFASAAVAYLLFMGPAEVLLPYLVKNAMGGSASDLGLVFAAGGIGSVGCAVVVGQRGLPKRDITFMYLAWTAATVAVAGYGLATAVWQLMLASFCFNALETAGTIVWGAAKQSHVPAALLGRVSSLDWLISIGLLPVSFAVTGPVSAAIGAQTALVAAGGARGPGAGFGPLPPGVV